MIIRIVVMRFTEAGAAAFRPLFLAHRERIRASTGCSRLTLMKMADEPYAYATWSHWETLEHLEAYRRSALFVNLWKEVKPLFAAPPVAHSLEASPEIG